MPQDKITFFERQKFAAIFKKLLAFAGNQKRPRWIVLMVAIDPDVPAGSEGAEWYLAHNVDKEVIRLWAHHLPAALDKLEAKQRLR